MRQQRADAGAQRLAVGRMHARRGVARTGQSHAGEQPALRDPGAFCVLPRETAGHGPFSNLMLVGTGGGIAVFKPDKTREVLRVSEGLLSNSIYSLARDAEGRIWIGT